MEEEEEKEEEDEEEKEEEKEEDAETHVSQMVFFLTRIDVMYIVQDR